MNTKNWQPLESNPDVMTKYLNKIGVPVEWSIIDVLGLDEVALHWVPRPALALLLLFPCSKRYEEHKEQEETQLQGKPQEISPNVFYMKQTVRNACGTMALLHSVANNTEQINLQEGWLKKYFEDAKGLDPQARAALLEKCEQFINAHQEFSREGQSNQLTEDEASNHHFVALVQVDGCLYELDGNKSGPINHGTTSPDTFLEDAAVVCRKFMERDPDDVNFTVVALAATQ